MEYKVNKEIEKKYRLWAILLSVLIPSIVIILFSINRNSSIDLSFLPLNIARKIPHIYASFNFLTALFLVIAVIKIKQKNVVLHAKYINLAVYCSLLFLVGYLMYHLNVSEQKYGDVNKDGILSDTEKLNAGWLRIVYYSLLLTHILLSCAVIPLVLFTYLKGWARNIVSHKKIAKFAFPIWFYVAISGVICYLMILPYY